MPLLVTPQTIDTTSSDALCVYAAKALGGAPVVSPNIKIGRQSVEFYTSSTVPQVAPGVPLPTNIIPLPCQPGTRVIVPTLNQTVFFNRQLPAVQGDKAQMAGTDRPLVGPFGDPTVVIGSRG